MKKMDYLTIRQLQEKLKADNIKCSRANIYKRINSGLDWGVESYRGMFRISLENYNEKWIANPPFKKMGRPVKKSIDLSRRK